MRKLKLESLNVESFDTTASASRLRGTVAGYADTDAGPDSSMTNCAACPYTYYGCHWSTNEMEACVHTDYDGCVFVSCACVGGTEGEECAY
jgi:hypothetical protein